ncbi:MAG: TlpA family protein disulfide reductase [Planctomycetota bacterium]|nr:TlpA family protein disulfide reductase [Planctomycetota bacterium]
MLRAWLLAALVFAPLGRAFAEGEAPPPPPPQEPVKVQERRLGDSAPALKVQAWVRGEAVDLKAGEGKTVFVIDFWGSWIPPCRETVPFLDGLQARCAEKGVIVVGLSVEEAPKVETFLKKLDAQPAYRIAVDPSGETRIAYMAGFGVTDIPHSFVVDRKGKVVWHGHPLDGLEEALGKILDGSYDLDAAKKLDDTRRLIPEYFEAAQAEDGAERAARLGQKIFDGLAGDPKLLSRFAYAILFNQKTARPDKDLAMKAAQTAYEKTGGKMLATQLAYARALFAIGKFDEAVRVQEEAVATAPAGRPREQMQQILEDYKKQAGK